MNDTINKIKANKVALENRIASFLQEQKADGGAMTKRKPGAVRGRPKGSGEGLDEQITARVPPWVKEELEAAGRAQGVSYGTVVRDVLGRWAKRQAKEKP